MLSVGESLEIAPLLFCDLGIASWDCVYYLRILKVGDRYSKPTKHNHSDTDKTLAICGDSLQSALAIAD